VQDKRARTKSQPDGKSDGRKDTSTDSQSLAVIDKFGSKVVAGHCFKTRKGVKNTGVIFTGRKNYESIEIITNWKK